MAGKLVTNEVQLGDHATSTFNFVLKTLANGTMKLVRGVIGGTQVDVFTINADNSVSFAFKRTRVQVTSIRNIGVDIVNSTGDEMFVEFSGTNNTAGGGCVLVVDGTGIQSGGPYANGQVVDIQGVVPAGSTYRIQAAAGTVSKGTWFETKRV